MFKNAASYQDYTKRKQREGEKPLSKDQWEARTQGGQKAPPKGKTAPGHREIKSPEGGPHHVIPSSGGNSVFLGNYTTKHIQTHAKPGKGSVFNPKVKAQDITKAIGKIPESFYKDGGGVYEVDVPNAGYDLVQKTSDLAKKYPNAKRITVPKQEGVEMGEDGKPKRDADGKVIPKFVNVTAFVVDDDMDKFSTNKMSVVVRPANPQFMPDEAKADKNLSKALDDKKGFAVLTAFPGKSDVPKASEWGDDYAIVVPSGGQGADEDVQKALKSSSKKEASAMTDQMLRKQLIRLAHSNPEMRGHLLPILAETETLSQGLRRVAMEEPSLRPYLLPIPRVAADSMPLEERMFTNPKTKNKVKFTSLPSEIQKKIRESLSKGKKPEKETQGDSKKVLDRKTEQTYRKLDSTISSAVSTMNAISKQWGFGGTGTETTYDVKLPEKRFYNKPDPADAKATVGKALGHIKDVLDGVKEDDQGYPSSQKKAIKKLEKAKADLEGQLKKVEEAAAAAKAGPQKKEKKPEPKKPEPKKDEAKKQIGKTASLRSSLIRLANTKPHMRAHLLPMLRSSALPEGHDKDMGGFEEHIKGKTFTHPKSHNKVQFSSLPADMQKRVRNEYRSKAQKDRAMSQEVTRKRKEEEAGEKAPKKEQPVEPQTNLIKDIRKVLSEATLFKGKGSIDSMKTPGEVQKALEQAKASKEKISPKNRGYEEAQKDIKKFDKALEIVKGHGKKASLRSSLIRRAHEKPELREHLLSILARGEID